MFFGPITDAFAGFRVGDQIKTGTRFLGGCRFETVVFCRSLVHAALQNRNFLKQNAYNGKCRFS